MRGVGHATSRSLVGVSFRFVSFRFFSFRSPSSARRPASSRHLAIKVDWCNMHFWTSSCRMAGWPAGRSTDSPRLDESPTAKIRENARTGATSSLDERSLSPLFDDRAEPGAHSTKNAIRSGRSLLLRSRQECFVYDSTCPNPSEIEKERKQSLGSSELLVSERDGDC